MIARLILLVSVAAIFAPAVFAQTKSAPAGKQYRARDGKRAEITPVDKLTGFENYESRVDFYGANGKRMCAADYSSADGTHGFGVAKAQWTPDGRYFVFSMSSSGGHQPWHAPTNFYSADDHLLCSLDDFLDPPGIATPDFMLSAPNRITTFVYGKMGSSSTPLDRIQRTGTRTGQPRCVPCNSGAVHEFGDRTMPYGHSPK